MASLLAAREPALVRSAVRGLKEIVILDAGSLAALGSELGSL
jgi:hypothetical protein